MPSRRPLHPNERELVRTMLNGNPDQSALTLSLDACLVEEMQDGGMGSIRFAGRNQRKRVFGNALAGAEYSDDDGVLVSIAINADDCGELYELDFWKVDFSPLRRYPTPSDLRMKS